MPQLTQADFAAFKAEAESRGIFLPSSVTKFAMDADVQPGMPPNGGIPAIVSSFIDPEIVRTIFAKQKAVDILGEKKKGAWAQDTLMIQRVEQSGHIAAYDDYSEQGGDPNKALSEFSRYGKTHSQENLMQVMSAAGFDPADAAKIKSGELKSLVDSETKKSNITAQQVKEQERLVATLGQLDAEFDRLRQDIAIAFAPDVIVAMKEFGAWIRDHHGDIIGFFREAGDSIKKLTDSVGGATALLILLAAGLRANPLVMGAIAAAAASNRIDSQREEARKQGKSLGQYLVDKGHEDKTPFLTWDSIKSLLGFDEVTQYGQSSRLSQTEPRGMDDLLHGVMMTESGGNPLAYNASSGAAGAYQFMPATAREMGLKVNGQEDERLDPEKSRAAASVYLRRLLKKYDGNTDNALRAYNWGMGNVDKWIANGSNPADLPKETREYTGKVRGNMGDARNYYATQGRLADGNQYQLSSSGGNPQITNSTNINTVNVNSNPQTVDALTQSIQRQSQRSSTNASFSSAVR